MYATLQPQSRTLRSADPLHTALLATAAVIVGGFLIGVLLVVSLMLAGPLPATDGAAPVPQVLPQPSATSG